MLGRLRSNNINPKRRVLPHTTCHPSRVPREFFHHLCCSLKTIFYRVNSRVAHFSLHGCIFQCKHFTARFNFKFWKCGFWVKKKTPTYLIVRCENPRQVVNAEGKLQPFSSVTYDLRGKKTQLPLRLSSCWPASGLAVPKSSSCWCYLWWEDVGLYHASTGWLKSPWPCWRIMAPLGLAHHHLSVCMSPDTLGAW